ncbi:glycosyltransferase family 61 protein [Halobacterium salinarum]|uniref:glycosyltransferase family 61 protein n=1 Tax=Halobacterium salinarum TaxID=2242 RepID=UPI0025570047|nr:glycosyltransferase family 61 protein [Halobacterium salinarum]MDL0132495.1 glycosyltransferase family 61 protein [Halobacterium salinarum]
MKKEFYKAKIRLERGGIINLINKTQLKLRRICRRHLIVSRLAMSGLLSNYDLDSISSKKYIYTRDEQVRVPKNSSVDLPHVMQNMGAHDIAGLKVFEIEDFILTGRGLLISNDGEFVVESTRSSEEKLADYFVSNTNILNEYSGLYRFMKSPHDILLKNLIKRETDEYIFPMIQYNSWNNYYHWILETLPTVRAYERYKSETGNSPTILLKKNPPEYMIESLSLLGIEPDQWKSLQSTNIYMAPKNIIFPERRYWTGDFNDQFQPSGVDLKWLSRSIKESVNTSQSPTGSKLYISRNDASVRRVINESEVMDRISQYGFEKILLSEYSVRDQVKIFSNAESVIAPHGAGLANTIFSDDINILEFIGERYRPPWFYYTSLLTGHNHQFLYCEETDGDYYVNIDKMIELI